MWCGFDIMISSEGGTEVCMGGYGVVIRTRTPYIDDRSDMLDPGVPWYGATLALVDLSLRISFAAVPHSCKNLLPTERFRHEVAESTGVTLLHRKGGVEKSKNSWLAV